MGFKKILMKRDDDMRTTILHKHLIHLNALFQVKIFTLVDFFFTNIYPHYKNSFIFYSEVGSLEASLK